MRWMRYVVFLVVAVLSVAFVASVFAQEELRLDEKRMELAQRYKNAQPGKSLL